MKAILFDLDGTLSNSKEGITKCVQYALKHFGIDEPDRDKLEVFIGPPLVDSFMKFYNMTLEQAKEATLTRLNNLPFWLSKEQRSWLENRRKDKRPEIQSLAQEQYELRFGFRERNND